MHAGMYSGVMRGSTKLPLPMISSVAEALLIHPQEICRRGGKEITLCQGAGMGILTAWRGGR